MSFRDKIKRVFSRSGSNSGSNSPQSPGDPNNPNRPAAHAPKHNLKHTPTFRPPGLRVPVGVKPAKIKYRANGKPKIELYKAHEVPRSKYRGPFDEAHIERLAAYSISGAMVDGSRPRSMLSEMSPTGTRAPPTRRGSLVGEGGEGARHPLANATGADMIADADVSADADTMIMSSSAPPTSTPLCQTGYNTTGVSRMDLDGRSDITTTTVPAIDPIDVNVSSSTLLTLRTEDTLAGQQDAVPPLSSIPIVPVSGLQKVSGSQSVPVSSQELSNALSAIQLR
ncbi:hypothetical protein AJ79_08286 [Helicocarpus griseus UAMH5409]|uniref:Uncharacterized protein n=1 Tax=Helicocarpus griseus UAMH5409 TaxID=1447875 RepID=A0A2B7WUK2_9EURO|nr:hypothetical protein AJ79_08286 [Helicocarpus griseus UAMH5409]